jgi:hypothetical protein
MFTLSLPRSRTRARTRRKADGPLTPVRIFLGPRFLGQLLLDANGQLWRRGPEVPTDIALKVLVVFSRSPVREGEVRGRDGHTYLWRMPEADDLSEVG